MLAGKQRARGRIHRQKHSVHPVFGRLGKGRLQLRPAVLFGGGRVKIAPGGKIDRPQLLGLLQGGRSALLRPGGRSHKAQPARKGRRETQYFFHNGPLRFSAVPGGSYLQRVTVFAAKSSKKRAFKRFCGCIAKALYTQKCHRAGPRGDKAIYLPRCRRASSLFHRPAFLFLWGSFSGTAAPKPAEKYS